MFISKAKKEKMLRDIEYLKQRNEFNEKKIFEIQFPSKYKKGQIVNDMIITDVNLKDGEYLDIFYYIYCVTSIKTGCVYRLALDELVSLSKPF